nr:MAG TPA: hypothetical protein [Herelleviridae sp.]
MYVSVKFRAKCIEICINMHYFINVTFVTRSSRSSKTFVFAYNFSCIL